MRADAVFSQLDSIIDLEFYMPVPEHRERWNGNTTLLVAGNLFDDGTIPRAFALDGAPVELSSAIVPPDTPTLVLVQSETDFSSVPHEEEGTTRILGAYQSSEGGLWMTAAVIYDDHEGWSAGLPEFENACFQERQP
jgi:hypothetical protein